MNLKFLGTGTSTGVPILLCKCAVCTSSDPHDKRLRPSVQLEFNDRSVVIDTTPDFRSQALRAGMKRLDAIIYTHGHADHIMGLDDTRVFYFHQHEPIPVYADERCMQTLRSSFSYIFNGNYKYGGVVKLDPRLIEGPFDLWGLTITPIPIFHGSLPIFGYRFRNLAYLTDVSEIPATTFPLLEGLDTLIIDGLRPKPHPTHFSLEQSLAAIEKINPRRAYLTHIAHELGHKATNAALPPHVQLAYDEQSVEF